MWNGSGGKTPALLCKSKVHLEHEGTGETAELAAVPSIGDGSISAITHMTSGIVRAGLAASGSRFHSRTRNYRESPRHVLLHLPHIKVVLKALFIMANPNIQKK